MNHKNPPIQMKALLTRRHFLGSVAAAGIVSLARRNDCRADPEPVRQNMTLGFSTYGLKSLPTEQAIKTMREIGFDAVELAVLAGWDADAAKLPATRRTSIQRQLKESAVKLTALMENLPPSTDDAKHRAGLERLKAAAQLAHDLCPDEPPLIETVLGGKDWEAAKPLFLRRLPDWVKIADDAKIVIAIKPHRGSAMSRPEQAIALFQELGSPPRLRMVYDYSHFALRDMPMEQTIRTSLPWTAFVSVKDVANENGRDVFKLPGETGAIDYPAMLRQLSVGGYHGDINCEVSAMISNQPGYDGVAAARQCYANLGPAFTAAGVARPAKG